MSFLHLYAENLLMSILPWNSWTLIFTKLFVPTKVVSLMEVMNRKPLFPGKDHVHQMRLLTELRGKPTEYLARVHDIADEPVCSEPFFFDFEQQPLLEEQMKDMIYAEAISLNPEHAY
ncbi:MITOGEN-ACTIVATED PROTEIN KINASE [Salix purpurea]|uniref:MITOGEN-ACTIVATED PROTEIN KINASE n=1 Tax=Salix purpurea TaxID=77065 RepID=A0A9Q0VGX2_SALPP|nr:MITOGEN-ACTIVATED PROTEIN KINASE [Salix purpurea]